MTWHNENSALIFWAAIAIIVVAKGYFRHQSRLAHYRMMEKMAEKGQPIPPEVAAATRYTMWDQGWERHDTTWGPHFSAGHGIILMCIGVALAVFLWGLSGAGGFVEGHDVPRWLPFVGIFPFMIGLGRVISALTMRPPRQ